MSRTGKRGNRILGALFAAAFVITCVGTWIFSGKRAEGSWQDSSYWSEAEAPVIYMETESGGHYDCLTGFKDAASAEAAADRNLVALPSSLAQKMVIETYGSRVDGIRYELRRADGQLLETGDITDPESSGTQLSFTVQFRDLMSTSEDSLLTLYLTLADGSEYEYVTRIIPAPGADIDAKLAYFHDFFNAVYDKSRSAEAAAQLYVVSGKDNSSFGNATINTSAELLTWGTLQTVPMREIVPSLRSVTDDECEFYARYPVLVTDSSGVSQTIMTEETTTIGLDKSGNCQVDNYQRTAGEVFSGSNAFNDARTLNLGIQGGGEEDMAVSASGTDYWFFNAGNLWRYASGEDKLIRVFSYESSDSDGVREDNEDYIGRILRCDDDGDCWFALMGYVSRGRHEGQTGLSVWHYSASDDATEEMLFFPMSGTAETIAQQTGTLMSVGGDGVFYLSYGGQLLTVGTPGNEVSRETVDFSAESFAASSDQTQIAYCVGTGEWKTLRVVNLKDATAQEITAPDGDCIRPLGYIGHDLVYGLAHSEDINEAEGSFPMYRIGIVNDAGEQEADYQPDGSYILQVQLDAARVLMSLGVKQENESFLETGSDQLISRSQSAAEIQTTTVTSDEWKKETAIYLPKAAASSSGSPEVEIVWNITENTGDLALISADE